MKEDQEKWSAPTVSYIASVLVKVLGTRYSVIACNIFYNYVVCHYWVFEVFHNKVATLKKEAV